MKAYTCNNKSCGCFISYTGDRGRVQKEGGRQGREKGERGREKGEKGREKGERDPCTPPVRVI